jgi:Ca2+-transporting ATPase
MKTAKKEPQNAVLFLFSISLKMTNESTVKGLTKSEVLSQRTRYGTNAIQQKADRVFGHVLKSVVLEPMFLLLLGSSFIYILLGEGSEAFILFIALLLVAGISFFQEFRSRKAIQALRKLSSPKANVIRDGLKQSVQTDDLVVGDLLLIEEGELIPADGQLFISNDFSVNESILTGEAFPVQKSAAQKETVYRGCLVTSGSATVLVSMVGVNTQLGRIGISIQEVSVSQTPLQQQIKRFILSMVWIGVIAFVLVIGFAFYQTGSWTASLLQGFTMAMSVLPEEIPVAFSTFMALGAYRLMKHNNILVKQPQYVETLGSATVICADKTGTITQNNMQIQWIYDVRSNKWISATDENPTEFVHTIMENAVWSSETDPFDPMEKAIHQWYELNATIDLRANAHQIHEYPLSGKPPRMTHIFQVNDEIVISVKGGVEAILQQSNLTDSARANILLSAKSMAEKGLRLLGVGKSQWHEKHWPVSQDEFEFEFLGILAFQDPPKVNIQSTIQSFKNAGIQVKMITGDYPETAIAIAKEIGLIEVERFLTGASVMNMNDETLKVEAMKTQIFARMFPEAKLKVIRALQDCGEVVAMTGDGVNDGPALKAAHIGIAMGLRGSELAKSTAALILTDDDLSHMVDAVGMGRRIYDNLQNAIQYIISIHVPILLIVSIPCLFFWRIQDIFSPLHVIILELIMGPTCSIVFEREPMDPLAMNRPPRKYNDSFLTFRQLVFRIIQGLLISAACLIPAYFMINQGYSAEHVRTIVFSTLVLANMMLTLVNRSSIRSIFRRNTSLNRWMIAVLGAAAFLLIMLIYFKPAANQFGFISLKLNEWIAVIGLAITSTLWVEGYKLFLRHQKSSITNIVSN